VNRRVELHAKDKLVNRPLRLWWLCLLLPLMGFERVVSERPLTPTNEGFIDRAVIGDWASASGDAGTLALTISREQSGLLEVRTFDHDVEGVPYLRFRAYSSRLGDDTYANLELFGYGCLDCDGAELATARAEIFDPLSQIVARSGSTCKFIVLKYQHTADDRLIVYSYGDGDFVKLAIEQQRLGGRVFAANAGELAGVPCITESAEGLHEFYSRNAAALFPEAGAQTFVRQREPVPVVR
jgi:hypothetical protein